MKPTPIIAMAALVVGATALTWLYAPASGRAASAEARYRIASADKMTAWRIDTRTGKMAWCQATGPGYQIRCYGRNGELAANAY